MSLRTHRDGAVLTLTIDRPEQRNSLDVAVLDGLVSSLSDARTDGAVRVVVLTGAGDRAFCAGADLTGTVAGSDGGAVATYEALGRLRDVLSAIDALDKPLIGRINGHALAGGFGLALACDILVAADHATFGTPEVKVGMWPFIISAIIVDHLGPKRAYDLMLTGRRIDGDEALRWGLVNRVVPSDELDTAVNEYVGLLTVGSPTAQRLGRRSLVAVRDMRREDALHYLHGMLDLIIRTEDVEEGITAFLEKRDPTWTGR